MKTSVAVFILIVLALIPSTGHTLEIKGMLIYSANGTPNRKEVNLNLSGSWLSVNTEDANLENNDSLFFCYAIYKQGKFAYGEIAGFGCPNDTATHYHCIVPKEVVEVYRIGKTDLVMVSQSNGWMSLITAKNRIEARYLNVRLAPWYRPFHHKGLEKIFPEDQAALK